MLILLKLVWQYDYSYVDPNDNRITGDIFRAEKWEFDTATRTVIYTARPDGGFYDFYTGAQGNNDPPEDVNRDPTEEFYAYVSGPTRIGYHHNGSGGLTLDIQTLTLVATPVGCQCFGTNTGSIDLQVSGLPGPYTYRWDDGPTVQDRGVIPSGTYRVTVTAVPSGAVARLTCTVGTNPEISVLIRKAGGDVSLEVSGGVGVYTYLWSNGSTTRDQSGLANGAYSCVITDVLGCSTEIEVQVDNDQFYWSRNAITLALNAGAAYRLDPTTKPNLTFLCEVWIEKEYLSGEYTQVGTVLEQPADRFGRTVFEVQALLDTFLQHHVPAPDARGLVRADPLFRRFYLKYAQNFGTPPVRSGTTALTVNYVVLGGLNFYEASARTWFNSYQASVQPFLTWEPTTKPALLDQPEYLYYQVRQELPFRFVARVKYTDGTTEEITLGGNDEGRKHEVYCQAVGYEALDLATVAGTKRVEWWEVFVSTYALGEALAESLPVVLSEVRRFVLDRRTFPKRRYLLFATSLGGMATYAATGDAVLEAEVQGEESTRSQLPGYDPAQGDTVVQTRSLRPVVKVASGPRTRAQQLASQDLLLSRRVLLLQDGRWVPGYLKAKTIPLVDESKPVQSQEFDFFLPTEKLYTPFLA